MRFFKGLIFPTPDNQAQRVRIAKKKKAIRICLHFSIFFTFLHDFFILFIQHLQIKIYVFTNCYLSNINTITYNISFTQCFKILKMSFLFFLRQNVHIIKTISKITLLMKLNLTYNLPYHYQSELFIWSKFFLFLISPLMQGYLQDYIQMTQAQIKLITSSRIEVYSPIQIHWNALQANIVQISRGNSKYKKVTIEDKQALMSMVKSGSSIINAARILNINYSTAKSIFQNIKTRSTKKRKRTHFIQTDSESQSQSIKQTPTN